MKTNNFRDMKTKRLFGMTILSMVCIANLFAQEGIAPRQEAWSTDTTRVASVQPDQWTLQDCIDYALQQNITIQQNRLQAVSADIDVKNAKADFLPSVSASVSQNVSYRPNASTTMMVMGSEVKTSNNKTSYNGSYGINANWTVFNGKRINTLKQQKLNSEAADLDVAQSENNIIQQITQIYIQILYAAESIKVNEANLEVSEANAARGKQLFEAGSSSKADYAQLASQVSQDKYQLVNSQAQLQNYKLQLKQLLEIDGEEEMNLFLPELNDDDVLIPLPSKTDVYNAALAMRPEIQASKLDVEAADLNIKVAKAGYLPTISMTGNINSNNMNGSGKGFGTQLSDNWSNSIGVSVSIPIYDKRQTKSQIQKARIQKQNSELSLQSQQKTLYSNIEGLWLDANTAQQQYLAAKDQLSSAQTSFDLVQEQFNLGMKNTVELLKEQTNLLNAQNSLLQAKYMAIMNQQLLRFYGGESIVIG
jgi:outer membrane protein